LHSVGGAHDIVEGVVPISYQGQIFNPEQERLSGMEMEVSADSFLVTGGKKPSNSKKAIIRRRKKFP